MLNSAELAKFYKKFRVDDPSRTLLTGHSHQAWPDCAFEAQERAWLDAAEHVDDKWALAFEKAECVREGYASLMGDTEGEYGLGGSTHELIVRWMSGLPYRTRSRIVTTTSEFHSIRRQLERLSEEGVEVVAVPAYPARDVGARVGAEVDDRTAAVMLSAVFYDSAQIAGALDVAAEACERHGAALLIDTYHALNVMPFDLAGLKLLGAFITGGGYKYCQLGEGNCFLRAPRGCAMRPVFTGWFADFGSLSRPLSGGVGYAPAHARFEGATYDPVSHYRAAEVFKFFAAHGLTPRRLRALYQHQLRTLAAAFDALALPQHVIARDTQTPIQDLGGFLSLRAPQASAIQSGLRKRGVFVDHRGEVLRLGPAPYLTDDQLTSACEVLGEVVQGLRGV